MDAPQDPAADRTVGDRTQGGHTAAGADERPPGPGAALAAARRDRDLTPQDVARRIQLRETVVRAIERDDFSLCGGDVYARGHVRAYARLVGLDPETLLAGYSRLTGRTPQATPKPAPVFQPDDADVPLEHSGPNWTAAMAVALGLLVVFLVVQGVAGHGSADRSSRSVAGAATTSASTGPAPTGSVSSPPAPSSTRPTVPGPIASAPSSGVTVVMTGASKSWVSVRTGSGRTLFSGLLAKGQSRTFTDAKKLRLTVGNAAGVTLVVNGKRLGAPGSEGQVMRLTFGPGDPGAA